MQGQRPLGTVLYETRSLHWQVVYDLPLPVYFPAVTLQALETVLTHSTVPHSMRFRIP
jgi:hypothetical protein